jgi:hypothetical protein
LPGCAGVAAAPLRKGRRRKEEGRRRKEEGGRKKEDGGRRKQEGRRKKEEERGALNGVLGFSRFRLLSTETSRIIFVAAY